MNNESEARFHKLLKHFNTAMLVTHAGKEMHARPMVIAKVEDNGNLWFLTERNSPKIREIEADSNVTVICQDERYRCISILGQAHLSQDKEQLSELWKAEFKAWFPEGESDPNIVMIHVHGREAEFWDNHGLVGVRYLFKAIKAAAVGDRPKIEKGKEHGRVQYTEPTLN